MAQAGGVTRVYLFSQFPIFAVVYLYFAGWWRYARKIHYTCDIIMALTWALATGTSSALPYIYPAFFLCMILHRYTR